MPPGVLTRPWVAALVLAVVAGGLAGCSGPAPNTVAGRAGQAGSQGYIAGDGTLERLAVEQRAEPVLLAGQTLQGAAWSSDQALGKVVVLNVWGSWCPPCEAEMVHLQSVWSQLSGAGRPVAFVGINIKESPQTASAAATRYGLTYPSLADDGGRALMALQGRVSAPPTTLVLDRSGRIAARISGPVTSPATLRDLIEAVLAEPASA
ncbi:MAG TPA: TlpA disulfide reductase family protein [Dermatophilaceae bacterium]|nr:TlpA disulfide reductase family protein [Dermatophilaceae bacterium]